MSPSVLTTKAEPRLRKMAPPNVATDVLRTLHRVHRQLTDLKGRLERGPKQVRATQAHVAHREELLAQLQAEAKVARVAADAKQLQLRTGEDKIVELKAKLNVVGSNREYQALKDQIAAKQMTNSVLEDEILEGLERIDEFNGKAKEAESNLAKAQEKAQKVRAEVEHQEPLIRGDVARLETALNECEANIPIEVKDVYRRVVRHRGEDALAAVENQYCNGCHQHVPLNMIAEMMLGRPMFCKVCGRLLYIPEEGPATG